MRHNIFSQRTEPIQFTKCIQNIVVSEHQSATFECEVPLDDAIVTWYKGPTELIESQKYNSRNDGRCHYMTIHNVTPDEEGVYSVITRLEPRGEARSTAEPYLTTKEIKFEMKPPEIKMFSSRPIRNSAVLQFGCQFIPSTHTRFCSLVNEQHLEGNITGAWACQVPC
ncbi:myosin-binding protein C, cardiac-type-like isoform X2 [Saccopteryx leptura]|uniref:myosin-binding protein C, cardiac-type-like isoform X2 n=1 Tax=Saccopteryx leptura TaxID=249018 RepID=UPI00339D1577